jgi:hypothetical protein
MKSAWLLLLSLQALASCKVERHPSAEHLAERTSQEQGDAGEQLQQDADLVEPDAKVSEVPGGDHSLPHALIGASDESIRALHTRAFPLDFGNPSSTEAAYLTARGWGMGAANLYVNAAAGGEHWLLRVEPRAGTWHVVAPLTGVLGRLLPVADDGLVLSLSRSGHVALVRIRGSGEQQWEFRLPKGRVDAVVPHPSGGAVVFASDGIRVISGDGALLSGPTDTKFAVRAGLVEPSGAIVAVGAYRDAPYFGRLDESLNVLWEGPVGKKKRGLATAVVALPNRLCVGGHAYTQHEHPDLGERAECDCERPTDAWVACAERDGKVTWEQQYHGNQRGAPEPRGTEDHGVSQLFGAPGGGLVVVGSSNKAATWIFKLDEAGVAGGQIEIENVRSEAVHFDGAGNLAVAGLLRRPDGENHLWIGTFSLP